MPKRSHASGGESCDDHESSSEPHADSPLMKKRRCVEFEPVRICSIGSVKEIDHRTLRAQHYKLCERFRYKQKVQQTLEKRIEEFERRQVQDDAVNCIINRYWNMLDGDVQLLLQRYDDEESQQTTDVEMKDEAQPGAHFLKLSAQWSCEELDEKLKQRVESSQRTIEKLLQLTNRIGERNGKIYDLIKGEAKNHATSSEHDRNKANSENSTPDDSAALSHPVDSSSQPLKIDEELRAYATSVFAENERLQKQANRIQAENHGLKLQTSSNDDKVALLESRVESLNNEIEDLRYQLHKSMRREEKLDYRLAEYVKKENARQVQAAQEKAKADIAMNGEVGEEIASLSKTKLEELQQDLEIQTEQANSRLAEVQEVTERNKSLSAELENCKMRLKYISSEDIRNSTEYRCLQTAFSSLFEDCKLQRKELEDVKQQNAQIRQAFEEQINSMKTDEGVALERLQQTVMELDNDLNTARREYENVCAEYEVNTVSREQAAPIQEQIGSLMNSLSTQNTQLKQEVARLKRKCQEAIDQLALCQKELDGEKRLNNENYLILKLDDSAPGVAGSGSTNEQTTNSRRKSQSPGEPSKMAAEGLREVKKEEPTEAAAESSGQNGREEQNKSLRPESSNSTASRPSTPADMAEAVATIRRLRMERDRYREKLRQMARTELMEKKKQWTEEQKRRQRQLEEQCERLRRELQSAKQEEDGLMQEMESTGQAFEELQEQNKKLLEQLQEKEDVNLKMMSERIRNSQAQKKMRDEKDLLDQTIQSLENQLAAKMLLCQKFEEKERVLNEHRLTTEHELRIREQNNESLKKKAAEYSQLATDLRLRLDRLDVQFNELRENVLKKATTHEADGNKLKRLEEERSSLKRKLDRAKKMEKFENIDQVLQEENRILRESITCPSCKVRKKNAILSKCNHVFCFECLRQRYDNRRRKCPKCNAAFGANDFHRIYLELDV